MLRKTHAEDYENNDSLLNTQRVKNNRCKLKGCLLLSHGLFMVGGFGLAVLLYHRGYLDCPNDGGSFN